MIISDSFVKSQKARDNEFTTNTGIPTQETSTSVDSSIPNVSTIERSCISSGTH